MAQDRRGGGWTRAARSAVLTLSLAVLVGCGERWEEVLPGFVVTGTPVVTSESGATATFGVALTMKPSAPVDVDVRAGDATEGQLLAPRTSVSVSSISLHFTPSDWSVPKIVTVVGVDDAVRDGDVTWQIEIAGARSDDADFANAPATNVTAVNLDDDIAAIRLSRDRLATAETGATTDSFEVVLTSQPSTVVTVTLLSGNPSEGLLSDGSGGAPTAWILLLFTPEDWSTPRVVTVTGRPDAVIDGDVAYTVTVWPESGDPVYAALGTQEVIVVNADDISARLVYSLSASTLVEMSGATLLVRLATRPVDPVHLKIESQDQTELFLSATNTVAYDAWSVTLAFDAANWYVDQPVTLWGALDYVVDGPQTVSITLGPPTGDAAYAALPQESISVLVLDSN